MKTRFTSIVKIKKRLVDDIYNQLVMLESNIISQIEKIKQIETMMKSVEMPKSGEFGQILAINEIIHAYKRDLEVAKNMLQVLYKRKQELQDKMIEAQKEYEKMNYLEQEEIKKALYAKKKAEATYLDEVATMLFNNKAI